MALELSDDSSDDEFLPPPPPVSAAEKEQRDQQFLEGLSTPKHGSRRSSRRLSTKPVVERVGSSGSTVGAVLEEPPPLQHADSHDSLPPPPPDSPPPLPSDEEGDSGDESGIDDIAAAQQKKQEEEEEEQQQQQQQQQQKQSAPPTTAEATTATEPTTETDASSSSSSSRGGVLKKSGSVNQVTQHKSSNRLVKFQRLLEMDNCDIHALRKLAWSGVHPAVRSEVWSLLLGYLPLNRSRRKATLSRRRREYAKYVESYFDIDDERRTEEERVLKRQIGVDVPRTHPEFPMFQISRVQRSLERLLYVWAVRHPASGYVQGINDLATPFFVVFTSDCTGITDESTMYYLAQENFDELSDEDMSNIEADCFWCLSKLLDGIQDHYTFAQPGIQRMVFRLQELTHRIDADLFLHLQEQQLTFIQFAFRWINCLLMRELSLPLIVRTWDTYLSEPNGGGFRSFHLYVCAAFLTHWSEQLKEMDFSELIVFLQRLPTSKWTVKEVETILSQAYVYQNLFHESPHHLQ
eukprot:TRINITY_DN66583_c2_g1_i1.p1 TRINITY_DN66583_c2_g1~~TRINITY_DN66583_c2_g1_i1.p1  ORF type:complete len:521 (+),score=287.50 TRINITY_DN66583_c2_g1_i1:27-1589(+)